MVQMVLIHPVRDFDDFINQFSLGGQRRAQRGIIRHSIHRAVDNPNEVMITFEFRSREDAENLLAADQAIQAWLDRAGVDIYPAVFLGELVDHSSAATD